METGKTTKYLKYAIGEIILVVIGILIALQINNWNEERRNRSKENQYLKNLNQEFENQILEINEQINYEKKFLTSGQYILDAYNRNGHLLVDSLLIIETNILNDRRTFNAINPTYTELLNTGDMKILKDEDFRNKLIIYQKDLERLAEVIKLNNSSFIDMEFGSKIRALVPYYSPGMLELRAIDSLTYNGGISKKHVYEQLTAVALQKFEDEHVVMEFLNQVAVRYDYAWYHIKIMNDKKLQTIELLNTLKQ
jgi:hypothetical protein